MKDTKNASKTWSKNSENLNPLTNLKPLKKSNFPLEKNRFKKLNLLVKTRPKLL